jgi:hypothetical protein
MASGQEKRGALLTHEFEASFSGDPGPDGVPSKQCSGAQENVQFEAPRGPESPYPLGIAVGRFVALALHFRIRVGVAKDIAQGSPRDADDGRHRAAGGGKGQSDRAVAPVGLA